MAVFGFLFVVLISVCLLSNDVTSANEIQTTLSKEQDTERVIQTIVKVTGVKEEWNFKHTVPVASVELTVNGLTGYLPNKTGKNRRSVERHITIPESEEDTSSENEFTNPEELKNTTMPTTLRPSVILNPDSSTPDLDSSKASALGLSSDVLQNDTEVKENPVQNVQDTIHECYQFLMTLAKPLTKLPEEERHKCMHQMVHIVMYSTLKQQQEQQHDQQNK